MNRHKIIVTSFRAALVASMFAMPAVASAHHHHHHISIGHTFHQVSSSVSKGVDTGVKTVGNGVQNLAGHTASLSRAEMGNLRAQANQAFSATAGAFQSGYNASVAEVKKLVDGALEKLCRQAGDAFVRNNQQFLSQLQARMKGLDKDGQDALRRVVRAIPTRQVTPQTSQDMQMLASKLGFTSGAFSNGTLGISIGVSGSSASASVSGEAGIVMQTSPQGGKYRFGFVQSYGAGVGMVAPGVGTEIALTWSPGGIDNVPGPSVGFGGPGTGDMSIAMSWGVPTSLAGIKSVSPVPGFAVSLDIPNFWAAEAGPEAEGAQKAPDPAQFAFQGGYSLLSNKFTL